MERIKITPRKNYQTKVNDLGFNFDINYWLENAVYKFNRAETNEIEKATNECYEMYCQAVEHVIKHKLWDKLHIPTFIVDAIVTSWERDDLSLYGRFDFAFINGMPKLLEFNADTPTSLFEASVIQWQWKEDVLPKYDQFNSIHEALVQSWTDIDAEYKSQMYDFTCISDNIEDSTTTAYLVSTAFEAGLPTSMMDMGDILLSEQDHCFYAPSEDRRIETLFKLYPYEWMFSEEFGPSIPTSQTRFIEPLWKAVMSNKYMLVILAELFPNSPYILKAGESSAALGVSYCKKPVFSREGANVALYKNNELLEQTSGEYGQEGYVYQELVDIKPQDGMYPVIGSWVIGGSSCGIGIRETSSKITNNLSFFVPHVIE